MGKFSIKFENVNFDVAFSAYCETVAGELEEDCEFYDVDVMSNTTVDNENKTVLCKECVPELFSEIFPCIIIALLENGCEEFALTGNYDSDILFFAQYKDDLLTVSKCADGETENATYKLDDGMFEDEDGIDFDMFF